MDVCLNTDRMLAYFDTSGHDDQTLREVHGRTPAPEFLEWALERGIFARDGDGGRRPRPALGRPARVLRLRRRVRASCASAPPAAYGFDNAGPRPANAVTRAMRANQARRPRGDPRRARRGRSCGDIAFRRSPRDGRDSKDEHLDRPRHRRAPGGRRRSHALEPEDADVQIVVSDGLSAEAVHHNVPDLLPVLLDGLASRERRGRPADPRPATAA